MIPGEAFIDAGEVVLNSNGDKRTIEIRNSGDRPIQIGSHAHFFEVNSGLEFDRQRAYGFRLDVPSGTALRFEPGESREVELTSMRGDRVVYGMNAQVNGALKEIGS